MATSVRNVCTLST